jgi:hypothetical protein
MENDYRQRSFLSWANYFYYVVSRVQNARVDRDFGSFGAQ